MKELNLQSYKQSHPHAVWQKSIASKKFQSGFSLIEVMVAAFILGVGILGVVGLQVVTVKSTHQSFMRHQATNLIQNLAEKMRANINGTKASGYVIDSNTITNCTTAATSITDCATSTVTCNATQLASFDLNRVICGYKNTSGDFTGGLKQLLTSGRLEVSCQAGATACTQGHVAIKVSWLERALDKNEDKDADNDGNDDADFIQLATRIAE